MGMHGTFEQLRAAHPGKWLLIRTDGPEAQTGTLLFVDKDHDRVGEAMLRQPKEPKGKRPLYITYSFTGDEDQQPAIVTPFPADLW